MAGVLHGKPAPVPATAQNLSSPVRRQYPGAWCKRLTFRQLALSYSPGQSGAFFGPSRLAGLGFPARSRLASATGKGRRLIPCVTTGRFAAWSGCNAGSAKSRLLPGRRRPSKSTIWSRNAGSAGRDQDPRVLNGNTTEVRLLTLPRVSSASASDRATGSDHPRAVAIRSARRVNQADSDSE